MYVCGPRTIILRVLVVLFHCVFTECSCKRGIHYAAVPLGRTTGIVRPSVRLSVMYGLLTRKQKACKSFFMAGVKNGVPIQFLAKKAKGQRYIRRQKPVENDVYFGYMFTYDWRIARWLAQCSGRVHITRRDGRMHAGTRRGYICGLSLWLIGTVRAEA